MGMKKLRMKRRKKKKKRQKTQTSLNMIQMKSLRDVVVRQERKTQKRELQKGTKRRTKKVRDEHPDWKTGQIGKELGNRWNNLDAGRKKKYQDMADKAKAKYVKEMEAYNSK